MKRLPVVALAAVLALATACDKYKMGSAEEPAGSRGIVAPAGSMAMQGIAPDLARKVQGAPSPAQEQSGRYVAVRNFIVVAVDAAQVGDVLKGAQDACKAPACEILESSLTRDNRDAPPRARLRLRIVPAGADKFVDDLVRRGDLIERRVESEDKTDEVVDVDARIANTTALRDRLRKLLGDPKATVKDLAEVESQFARAQGDLDSMTGRRKALANETEKVAIHVEIRPRREIAEAGALQPIKHAVTAIGHTFADSLASLITFLIAAVPWLALIAVVVWLFRRWRRRRKAPA